MKVLINKTSVEEGINEELINILQSSTSLNPRNLIKVKKLKEISLRKLIELGQVEWKRFTFNLTAQNLSVPLWLLIF